MAISKAQQKANTKYVKNNYDTTLIRFKKGAKSLIEAAAKANNDSINGYVKKLSRLNMKPIQSIQ